MTSAFGLDDSARQTFWNTVFRQQIGFIIYSFAHVGPSGINMKLRELIPEIPKTCRMVEGRNLWHNSFWILLNKTKKRPSTSGLAGLFHFQYYESLKNRKKMRRKRLNNLSYSYPQMVKSQNNIMPDVILQPGPARVCACRIEAHFRISEI